MTLKELEKQWDEEFKDNPKVLAIVEWLLVTLKCRQKKSFAKIDDRETFDIAFKHIYDTCRDRMIGRSMQYSDTHFWKVKCVKMHIDAGTLIFNIKKNPTDEQSKTINSKQ